MTLLLLSAVALVATHYAVVTRVHGVLTAVGLFPLVQLLMLIGTHSILNPTLQVDNEYAVIMAMPLAVYCATGVTVELLTRRQERDPAQHPPAERPTAMMLTALTFSAAVTLIYFYVLGYNLFLAGLHNIALGRPGIGDVTTLRLAAYSGDAYLAPGYVNQFKNILLPLLLIALVQYRQRVSVSNGWLFRGVAGVIILISLLGTGQRGAFVLFALVLAIYLARYSRARLQRYALAVAVVAIPVFLTATFILGRSSVEFQRAEGFWAKVQVLLGETLARFVYDNQASGRFGYWFTRDLATQFGAEWWRAVRGILPGDPGSDLASSIYESIYGTDRGTMPPSLWGSVDYNFGVAGLLLIPIVLALIHHRFTVWSEVRPAANTLEALGRSGVHMVLATWVAGGPEYLLNTGLLAYVVVVVIAREVHRAGRNSRQPAGVDRARRLSVRRPHQDVT